jgi:hypothetical protein
VCTVVISLEPTAAMPLLLLGIRDELTSRPWQPPGRHWPGTPLIGGLDEEAGGTWLAVDPGAPSVACVLNGRGSHAPEGIRRTRGELPLGSMADLARYDPFHLLVANPATVTLVSWDGHLVERRVIGRGTHVITNSGLDPDNPKAKYFGPRFAAAADRPSGDPSAPVTQAWQPWLALAEGGGLQPGDPRGIRVRKQLPDGRVWGTTSISYVALGGHGLRYDFQPVPGDVTAVLGRASADPGREAELREQAFGVEEER